MQIIMDQKNTSRVIDDEVNIHKMIGEVDETSDATVVNEKSKGLPLLNASDILDHELTENGNILDMLDESSSTKDSQKNSLSDSDKTSDDVNLSNCIKESEKNEELTTSMAENCELKTDSNSKESDTYPDEISGEHVASEGVNEIGSACVTLENIADDPNNMLEASSIDYGDTKDKCKSFSENRVIRESVGTSSLTENTEVTAETIHMIEETILISEQLQKEETVLSADEKKSGVLPISEDSIDNKAEQTTETIEYNVIEYVDIDSNEILEKSTRNNVELKTIEKSNPTQSPNDRAPNSDKIDSNLSEAGDESSSVLVESVTVKGKTPRIENGKCTLERQSSEVIEDEKSADKLESSGTEKKRSVIEDIFDDWMDENVDEESVSEKHDDVEQELKSLLEDDKHVKSTDNVTPPAPANSKKRVPLVPTSPKSSKSGNVEDPKVLTDLEDKSMEAKVASPVSVRKMTTSSETVGSVENVKKTLTPHTKSELKQTELVSATPTKLTVEMTKEIKGSKDNEPESPRKEIIIVKKIKARSQGKPASVTTPLPQLIAIDSIEKISTIESKTHVDNKELLAILEGDEDPDWSDLTPPTLKEEPTDSDVVVGRNSPLKLDPLIERELALKQLLELPATPKKLPPKKKLVTKPTRGRPSKELTPKESREPSKKIVNINLMEKARSDVEATSEKSALVSIDLTNPDDNQDVKVDETRSGRKRKPTEKAREHEISAKRQKIIKSKITPKKTVKDSNTDDESKPENVIENNVSIAKDTTTVDDKIVETEGADAIITPVENDSTEPDKTIDSTHNPQARKSKEPPTKKHAQSSAKRKVVSAKIQAVKKSPAKSLPKKSPKSTRNSRKSADGTTTEAKPKKKIINEIDRLLQDEGVVNLLYDVEQPGKKRLVPVTKSQAKVMDILKVQRELKIRTKLVRNAVLRLRTSSTAPSNVTPRSKRSISHNNDQSSQQSTPEKKSQHDSSKSPRSSVTSPTDFMYPATIRNAADASIIVRRHSSSSFSSASGSPRVSIDGLDRHGIMDSTKIDDNHTLRSNKRRLSVEDKKKSLTEPKKSKKELLNDAKTNDIMTILPRGKLSPIKSPKKVSEPKKGKVTKQDISTDDDDITSEDGSPMNTRSNGANARNTKNKKIPKSKVSFAKEDENEVNDELTEQDDALSACLAEAVTALTNDNGRTRTATINRKMKSKASDAEVSRAKDKIQFSNKEINVQRHGNLVQLILTPSTTTKIRNGITLQMMQEFREALTILKKDDDCRVVLLTSTGSSFCEGLELSTLLQDNKDTRRVNAQQLANGVKDFIKSLATFNKPIVAGVQGSAVGLGVTMLPLFDLVIASDKASFSTPYGKLGQIAEGAAVFTLSHVLGSAVTSELLLGGRTLTANEALRAGLVTRVLWPDRFQVELLPSLRAMSEQSSQSMEATKTLLRHSLRKKLDAALESESYLLVQHWCSTECQEAIRAYMDEKVQ